MWYLSPINVTWHRIKTLHTSSIGQKSESKNTYIKETCSTGQWTTYMHVNLASNTHALSLLCNWEKLWFANSNINEWWNTQNIQRSFEVESFLSIHYSLFTGNCQNNKQVSKSVAYKIMEVYFQLKKKKSFICVFCISL